MSGVQRTRSVLAVGVLAAGAMLVSACSDSPASLPYTAGAKVDCGGKQTLAASGSTAQANAMTRSVDAYRQACSGQTLNYTANGSGSGITDFLADKTDFAGSDTPLSAAQYAAAERRCGGADAWNLPAVFGPLAITYNLAAVDSLVLDAPTLAKIFNGTITRWDDPALALLNASMPAEDIHVIYRSDGSGTTDNFQDYLQSTAGGPSPTSTRSCWPPTRSSARSIPTRRSARRSRRSCKAPSARGRTVWPTTAISLSLTRSRRGCPLPSTPSHNLRWS